VRRRRWRFSDILFRGHQHSNISPGLNKDQTKKAGKTEKEKERNYLTAVYKIPGSLFPCIACISLLYHHRGFYEPTDIAFFLATNSIYLRGRNGGLHITLHRRYEFLKSGRIPFELGWTVGMVKGRELANLWEGKTITVPLLAHSLCPLWALKLADLHNGTS
jgi:hypothetical protein